MSAAEAPLGVWVDGRRISPRAPAIPADDRGLSLGDGCFETMLVHDRAIRFEAEHLMRLRSGLARLAISYPAAAVRSALLALRRAAPRGLAVARVTVTRGSTPRGIAPQPARARVVATLHRHAAPRPPTPLRAVLVRSVRLDPRDPLLRIKSLSRLPFVLAAAEAVRRGGEIAVISDLDGHLAGCASANLFAVGHGEVRTPPLSCGALPGIARAWAIATLRAQGVRVAERPVTPATWRRAAEAFSTNAVHGPRPLTPSAARAAAEGPVCRALRLAWSDAGR